MKLESYSHTKGQFVYHFEWCPKYRYNMFRQQKYITVCEQILRGIAAKHGMTILELSVMPDHIHIVVSAPPRISAAKALQLLKGGSSYYLFKYEPKFRLRYPRGHFWSAGKFGRSVGDTDLETTLRYVREQINPFQTVLSEFTARSPESPQAT